MTKREEEMTEQIEKTIPNIFPIITADERRLKKRGVKGVVFGKSDTGKTSLLKTLDPKTTLFIDMEAGALSVEQWIEENDVLSYSPMTWQECRDLAVYIGGINPALKNDQIYSKGHYDAIFKKYGDIKQFDKFETIFIDSITQAARLCMQWCSGQPQAFSEKTGKPDMRGAYGLHAKEMLNWISHLQHTPEKNIWFVGILDEKLDDLNRTYFAPQIEGQKVGLELPGILDQVITLAKLENEQKGLYRAFITTSFNQYGFPGKDRSGRLNTIEEPHLGKLMDKIKNKIKNNIE